MKEAKYNVKPRGIALLTLARSHKRVEERAIRCNPCAAVKLKQCFSAVALCKVSAYIAVTEYQPMILHNYQIL